MRGENTAMGLLIWVFPETSVLEYGFADLSTLFNLAPYIFMFLIPAITMRMFAEEKKSGTLELLLTKPLTEWQLILGKYFSGLVLVGFSLIPTMIYYFSIHRLGNPVGNLDSAGINGSYAGLFLLGGVFTAIGIFASAITQNQIVSFIIAVFLCFIIYSGFESVAAIDVWGNYASQIEQWGILYHYESMSRGLLDSRDLIYFLSIIIIMLMATDLVLKSRKW